MPPSAPPRPEVIVHQLTALSGSLDLRHFDRDFAQTNRLRTEGTDILLSAARAVGARRFVAQSFAGWPAARTGGPIKTEDDSLDPDPPAAVRTTLEAILLSGARGHGCRSDRGPRAALRGLLRARDVTAARPAGRRARRGDPRPQVPDRRRRRRRLVVRPHRGRGRGDSIAVERGAPGIYNVVDDHPSAVRDWLPEMARELGREASAAGAALARPDHGGRGGDRDDDRDSRGVEREGQARVRLDTAASEPGRIARRGAPPDGRRSGAVRGAASARVRDRLPDARQRRRSRGRRPGGHAAALQGRRGRRADRLPGRVSGDRGHPAVDRRAALGPRPARDVRRRVAARAPDHRRGRRSSGPGRARGLALARLPGSAREPHPGAAGGVPAARRVRLSVRPDRRDRRSGRGRNAPAGGPRAPRGRARPATLRDRARAGGAAGARASSPPPRRATSARSRRCSEPTSSCMATAAARFRRSPAHSKVANGSPRRSPRGRGRALASAASPRAGPGSTAPRARSFSIPTAGC